MLPNHSLTYDALIVGQGLAGSLLAWSLLQQGLKVYCIADNQHAASRVAAGLINPVTGQRFVLAESTPNMLTWAEDYYQQLEQQLHISCYHPTPMLRLFNNEKEQINCQKRFNNPQYHAFLHQQTPPQHLHAPFSGIGQQRTAWLNTNVLLDALNEHLQQHQLYQQASFCYDDLQNHPNHITYQGIESKKIIFCEGYRMARNPYFSWLPMQPAHGEIISCQTSAKLAPYIINQSKWLLPTSTHQCKIGATYEPDILQPTMQEKSQQLLLQFANTLHQHAIAFQVTKHQAGIRPATKDKQPFIGFHPHHPNMGIFNGFGSRGSLLIPWYAQAFSHTLQHQAMIPVEADISRYAALHV